MVYINYFILKTTLSDRYSFVFTSQLTKLKFSNLPSHVGTSRNQVQIQGHASDAMLELLPRHHSGRAGETYSFETYCFSTYCMLGAVLEIWLTRYLYGNHILAEDKQ